MGVVSIKKKTETTSSLPKVAFESLESFQKELLSLLRGKHSVVESLLCALLSSGHVLLEDVPGVGKTTVIKAIAKLLGTDMKRVQCTNDLLPSDIIGIQVYDSSTQKFVFHQGPIFSNILFVDELNRASPRTQSALLEAMGEGIVTVDRKTYSLPKPYIVFAAQNPSSYVGTYSLPESQLDRFAVKLNLHYPEAEKEIEIFSAAALDPLASISHQILSTEVLSEIQKHVEAVHVSERVANYVRRFVVASRQHPGLKLGVSTRGGVGWIRLAKARALIQQRDYVTPDDLIALARASVAHRLIAHTGNDSSQIVDSLLESTDIES